MAILMMLLLGQYKPASAQPACSSYTGSMIVDYSQWDWTIPTNHPNYCATWANAYSSNGRTVLGAPWFGSSNGTLAQINRDQDYLKEKGWVLLRMDLGGRVPTTKPYFILYNKYRGIIRTFFWIDNSGGTYQNGVVVTLSHSSSNGSYSPGALALSQKLVNSQDYYLQNRSRNTETIAYNTQFKDQKGWVVAEFQAALDSNVGNNQYQDAILEFGVCGRVSSTLTTNGQLNFKTDQQVNDGGYSVSGKSSDPALEQDDPAKGTKTFLANGQKILAAAGSADLTSFLDNFKGKADEAANVVSISASKDKFNFVSQTTAAQGGDASTLKKIIGVAGSLGAVFGLVGAVVGAIWPDPAPTPAVTPFYPTVSNGSLSLNGTLTTTYPLFSRTMEVPGSQHVYPGTTTPTDGGDQPYYDCPLGIFTIKNTPVLNKYTLDMYDGTVSDDTDCDCPTNYTDYGRTYDSYQVANDLVAVYNDAANLNLLDVQAAIIAETPTSAFNQQQISNSSYAAPNYVQLQIISGELEAITADANTVTYGTPFINLGDFKNEALTAIAGSKVYVRIKATLQRKDAGVDTPPIYYVQDYAIQANQTTTATNPNFPSLTGANGYLPSVPPFTNLAAQLIGGLDLSNNPSSTPYCVPPGTYSSPLRINAVSPIGAGGSCGEVTLNHPSATTASLLLSAQGVALGAGFSVTPGTSFIASTSLQAYRQGGQLMVEAFTGPCTNNSIAYAKSPDDTPASANARTSANTPDADAALVVNPNPTAGLVTVTVDKATAAEEGVLIVTDYLGREVVHMTAVVDGKLVKQLDLTGQQPGLYLVRFTTQTSTLTQKVLVQ